MRYSVYFQVYHGLHRLGKATDIFLCPCFPIFKMYRPKLSFPPHSQRYLEDEWGDQWWMVKGLRDDPPTKACFPPLNSKDYQFLSRVQRTGPVRQHITCPLRMLLPLPRDFGWVWVILWKSTQVERSSLFHRKGQQTQSSLEPHCTSHPSSLLDILHIPCVFCDQVERGLNWAKEDNGKQVFPPARRGWFFLYKERMRFTSDSLTQGTPRQRGHNVLKIRRLKGLLLLNPVPKSGSSTKLLLT